MHHHSLIQFVEKTGNDSNKFRGLIRMDPMTSSLDALKLCLGKNFFNFLVFRFLNVVGQCASNEQNRAIKCFVHWWEVCNVFGKATLKHVQVYSPLAATVSSFNQICQQKLSNSYVLKQNLFTINKELSFLLNN